MKVVSFWRDQKIRLGLLLDNEILEAGIGDFLLEPENDFFSDTISFVRGGELALSIALRLVALRPVHALHRLDQVKLAAPILLPQFFARAATTASITMKRSAHQRAEKSLSFS